MTGPERLALLLPWINDDNLPAKTIRQRIMGFLHGFECAGLRVPRDAGMWDAYDATEKEVKATRLKLVTLLESGFMLSDDEPRMPGRGHITVDDIMLPNTFPSLRFMAVRKGKRRDGNVHYELLVDGMRLRDLVAYLVMHLLTSEDITVSRCVAPQHLHWDQLCNRFVIWKGRGRRPKVCPDTPGQPSCANRVKAKAKQDKYKEDRRRFAAMLEREQKQKQQQGRKRR